MECSLDLHCKLQGCSLQTSHGALFCRPCLQSQQVLCVSNYLNTVCMFVAASVTIDSEHSNTANHEKAVWQHIAGRLIQQAVQFKTGVDGLEHCACTVYFDATSVLCIVIFFAVCRVQAAVSCMCSVYLAKHCVHVYQRHRHAAVWTSQVYPHCLQSLQVQTAICTILPS